jgi:ribonuclease P protein component
MSGPLFSAFCWQAPEGAAAALGPRLGLTVPKKAVRQAVVRNRIKRRFRDALRRRMAAMDPRWWLVINPRRASADAPFAELEREIDRLVERCASR